MHDISIRNVPASAQRDTRERILEVAAKLLLERGYAGFSYKDIAESVKIRKASVHHHFPAKADLGRAVVERVRRRVTEARGKIEADPETVRRSLDGYFRLFEGIVAEGAGICLGGRLGADYVVIPDEVREPYHAYVGEFGRWVEELMRAGQECGTIRRDVPPAELALLTIATVQGAVQISRVRGTEAYRRVVDQLRVQLLTPLDADG